MENQTTTENIEVFPIEDGTIENFNRETHKRGKSWVAIVIKDKSQPGGLRRDFLQRAPGGRVFAAGIVGGTWLEFAGDYYTTSGSKRSDRKYYRVLSRDAAEIRAVACAVDEVGRQQLEPEVIRLAERPKLVYTVTVVAPVGDEDYNYQITIERKRDTVGVIDDAMVPCMTRIGEIIMQDAIEAE